MRIINNGQAKSLTHTGLSIDSVEFQRSSMALTDTVMLESPGGIVQINHLFVWFKGYSSVEGGVRISDARGVIVDFWQRLQMDSSVRAGLQFGNDAALGDAESVIDMRTPGPIMCQEFARIETGAANVSSSGDTFAHWKMEAFA